MKKYLIVLLVLGCSGAKRAEIRSEIDSACVITALAAEAIKDRDVYVRVIDFCIERAKINQKDVDYHKNIDRSPNTISTAIAGSPNVISTAVAGVAGI
jgi:hypothetical protein